MQKKGHDRQHVLCLILNKLDNWSQFWSFVCLWRDNEREISWKSWGISESGLVSFHFPLEYRGLDPNWLSWKVLLVSGFSSSAPDSSYSQEQKKPNMTQMWNTKLAVSVSVACALRPCGVLPTCPECNPVFPKTTGIDPGRPGQVCGCLGVQGLLPAPLGPHELSPSSSSVRVLDLNESWVILRELSGRFQIKSSGDDGLTAAAGQKMFRNGEIDVDRNIQVWYWWRL